MRFGGLLTALVVAAAGCGGSADEPSAGRAPTLATAAVTATSASVTPVVPQALAFAAPLVGGGELDAATLAGQPVLLWFWSPF